MMKPSKVVFMNDGLEQGFNLLQEGDFVKKGIKRAIISLRKDAFSGIQIPKRLIPVEYVRKYGINNLWKCNLPRGWRLLYTITPANDVELITAILEWSSHKDYERKFKY